MAGDRVLVFRKHDKFHAFYKTDEFKGTHRTVSYTHLDVYKRQPQLYDLAAIQTEAGRSFGYSPSDTLDIIQSLYETHKVISYPRTQCRYVSSEKAKEFPRMLSQMSAFEDLTDIAAQIDETSLFRVQTDKKVVNDAEVNKAVSYTHLCGY